MDTDRTLPYPKATAAYHKGEPLASIKRRFHLTDEELRDIAPDEFDDATDEGPTNGY